MTKILMVCLANICRSPMARAVAQQMARDSGRAAAFEFDSAGTQAPQAGERLDPRAKAVLSNRKYETGNARSRRVTAQDFERFDLLLAMDETILAALQRQCPPQHQNKLRLLLTFAPQLGLTEVPDPYYSNLAGFEQVLDLCEAGVKGLLTAQAYTL